jgi:site-specific DNA-cytosine methylase
MYPGMVLEGVRPWHSTKEPAPTLSKSGNMAVFENGKLRKFTIKEAALLASFGEEFLFLNDGLARIGNSVPPNLMRAIALHIKQEILSKAS